MAARTDAGGSGVGAIGCGEAGACVTAPGEAASAASCGAGAGGCSLVIAVWAVARRARSYGVQKTSFVAATKTSELARQDH